MRLEGERLVRGEELHQERQPGAEPVEGAPTQQRRRLRGDRVVQGAPVGEDRRRRRVGAEPFLGLGQFGGVRPALEPGDVDLRAPSVVADDTVEPLHGRSSLLFVFEAQLYPFAPGAYSPPTASSFISDTAGTRIGSSPWASAR